MEPIFIFEGKVKDLEPAIIKQMDDELEVQGDITAEREAEDQESHE